MAPIEGVTQLQGDITSEATALQVAALALTLLMLFFSHTHDALPFQSSSDEGDKAARRSYACERPIIIFPTQETSLTLLGLA